MINTDTLRMLHWLSIAVIFYSLAIYLASFGLDYYPQLQTILWKLGHLTTASFFGYRLDISIFRKRITDDSVPLEHIRRAIIIVGSMVAISLGM